MPTVRGEELNDATGSIQVAAVIVVTAVAPAWEGDADMSSEAKECRLVTRWAALSGANGYCQEARRLQSFSSMTESEHLAVLRVWAALAWADGHIADAESNAMKRIIASSRLKENERATALSWLESKVDFDTAEFASMSQDHRLGIYRAAVRLANVDLNVADEEWDFLARLREGLHIREDQADEIERSILGE